MKKFFLVVITLLPTLLVAQNGIVISNFSVSGSTITLDLSWQRDGMPTAWLDSAWVFVDYNNAGVMKRLPLAAGATLTATSAPGVGKVITIPGNTQGVWVVGNARTEGSFSATVALPFSGSNVSGACAYASNYPPLGKWNDDGTILTITGTPPYTLQLESSAGTITVPTGSPFILPGGYTLQAFTDQTGAPGMTHCIPPTAPESLTASAATVCSGTPIILTVSGGMEGSKSLFEWGSGTVGENSLGTSSATTYSASPTTSPITTFWVRRVSTDGCGATAAATVGVAANAAPTPLFTDGVTHGCANSIYTVTATGSESYCFNTTGTPCTTFNTTTSYAVTMPANGDNQTVYVTVSNPIGCTATTSKTITGIALPTINTQPVAATVCYNEETNLSVSATTNNGTLNYQWYKNSATMGAAGQAATVATGNLTATTPFYVVVGNTAGCSVTSTTVNVTARANFTAGAIATTGQTICSGAAVNAIGNTTAATGGDASITYEWRLNGASIGTNAAAYTPTAYNTTTGTHTFTRWAHDGSCHTDWVQSTGSWVLTVNTTGQVGQAPGTCGCVAGSTNCSGTCTTNSTYTTNDGACTGACNTAYVQSRNQCDVVDNATYSTYSNTGCYTGCCSVCSASAQFTNEADCEANRQTCCDTCSCTYASVTKKWYRTCP